MVVIFIIVVLRDFRVGGNWGKCSIINGRYRENVIVRISDSLVMVVGKYRRKVICNVFFVNIGV